MTDIIPVNSPLYNKLGTRSLLSDLGWGLLLGLFRQPRCQSFPGSVLLVGTLIGGQVSSLPTCKVTRLMLYKHYITIT